MSIKFFSHYETMTSNNNEQHNSEAIKIFGFWTYLMSDCIFFATLFATYAVLATSYASGPAGKDIFQLPLILIESFFLLFSSFTCSKTILCMRCNNKNMTCIWLSFTFLFGLSFVCMEFYENYHLIMMGYGPNCSAYLSAFFTLISTHGLHIVAGLIWITLMILQVHKRGFTQININRLYCLSLFWHFLEIIWICIFNIVYLMGVL